MGEQNADNSIWPHTGAVLAGGVSKRMGLPKHALVLRDGQTMIETVAEVLGAVCEKVVVSGEVDAGIKWIADRWPNQGPMGGIEALLASGLDTQFLVCACDTPLLTPALLKRLTAPTDAPATVFSIDSKIQRLPVRLSINLHDQVELLLNQQRRAVLQLLKSVETEVIELAADEVEQLTNINTPQEYETLRSSLGS